MSHDDVARVERYECTDCKSGFVVSLDAPEVPDPDFYGNQRFSYKCPDCGERYTIVHAHHGGMQLPVGLRRTDDSR